MSDLSIQTSSLYRTQAQYQQQVENGENITAEEAMEFSRALAQEMAVSYGGQAGTSAAEDATLATGYMPMLLQATAGQGLESQLLMLCFMLMTGQADASSIMSVLAQAVAEMSSEDEKETLRRSIMDSSYSNDILDEVDQGVFGGNTLAYPYEAWKACSPIITNGEGERSAGAYVSVIDQFQVETNGRYANNKRGTGDTYCNIFTWDVTSAMGAELPHYVDAQTGAPRQYPDTKGARELTANATYEWLHTYGEQYGWYEVTAEQAQTHADLGGPAVVSWKNPTGKSGHLQVVRPELEGVMYDEQKGVAVAQAGSKLLSYTHTNDIFSERAMQQLKYFVHR